MGFFKEMIAEQAKLKEAVMSNTMSGSNGYSLSPGINPHTNTDDSKSHHTARKSHRSHGAKSLKSNTKSKKRSGMRKDRDEDEGKSKASGGKSRKSKHPEKSQHTNKTG